MCGEHSALMELDGVFGGSSPHVRGAHCWYEGTAAKLGIIPACAGSTTNIATPLSCARDHPRMCGEHAGQLLSVRHETGSSPHVRGAQDGNQCDHGKLGIIPACAGSTIKPDITLEQMRDHPRMCGEHPLTVMWTVMASGSSPHVRGARECWRRFRCGLGIIPACAGSTRREIRLPHFRRDHPRMCGEHRQPSV